MTKTKTIFIDDKEVILLIQRLQYEVESRKEIISYILTSNGVQSDAFNRYETEYQEFFIQYQTAKHEFEKQYVDTAMENDQKWISWDLDFESQKVTISY